MSDFEKCMINIFNKPIEGIYSRLELVEKLEKNLDKIPNPWEPSDYCYNISNKGIEFGKKPHLFKQIAHGNMKSWDPIIHMMEKFIVGLRLLENGKTVIF